MISTEFDTLLSAAFRVALGFVSAAFLAQAQNPPSFAKDVLPILQRECQGCHRPGEAGPFSMLTYESTRPWAAAMKEAVKTRKMPPWFADARYGKFTNGRVLSDAEIKTISDWADAKAPEGDPKDSPPPVEWTEGWQIGPPDKIYQLPIPFDVPASGVVDYQHIIVQSGFTRDMWVQAAEVRPTDRAVVHHIIAFIREPKSNWFRGEPAGQFFIAPQAKTKEQPDTSALPSDFLVGYAPGQPAEILAPGQAKLIKAGSDIVFQVHYTPNGHARRDQTRLGIVFAKEAPKQRVLTLSATNGTFLIPPGDPNYRVDASFEVMTQVSLSGLHPHMHGRGKDFLYKLTYPSGQTETILSVPHYNWHWQNWYTLEKPIVLPKGAKIECTAHFDNSPNNPDNADPKRAVPWGEQSWDEMMVGFFNLVFPADMPVEKILPPKNIAGIASR
ncbi:MAG: cytochrome c [Acidobacteriaceae bacterium]|nr:cytochrome c [Acidobacteriaceae bacterium]